MKLIITVLVCFIYISCKTSDKAKPDSKCIYSNKYESGSIKYIGELDCDSKPIKVRKGLWKEFYENGILKSSGKYASSSYTECCFSGYCKLEYSYKIGEWNYYYDNGKIMASGIYDKGKRHIQTNCEGGDIISFGIIGNNWQYFNSEGELLNKANEEIINSIKNVFLTDWNMLE